MSFESKEISIAYRFEYIQRYLYNSVKNVLLLIHESFSILLSYLSFKNDTQTKVLIYFPIH